MAEEKTTKPTETKKAVKKAATTAAEKKPAAKKATVKKAVAATAETVEKKEAAPAAPAAKPAAKKAAAKPVAEKAEPRKAAAKKPAVKAAPKAAAPAPKPQAAVSVTPEKAVSEYYVVRTIQRMAGSASALLGDYNENMKRILESGRDLVEDMGKGTAEILGNFVDTEKIKGRLSGLAQRTGVEKAGATAAAKTQEIMSRTIRRMSDTAVAAMNETNENLKKAVETGMDMVQDMSSVTRTAVSGIAERGRKAAAQMPVLGTLESGIANVSSRMNLPSKKDVAKLTEDAKSLLKSKLPKALHK